MKVVEDPHLNREVFSLASFIADAGNAALLEANAWGCPPTVRNVDTQFRVKGNRGLLLGVLANLLQNAFKFTRPHTEVSLSAYGDADAVFIDCADECGGLAPDAAEIMFSPFTRGQQDNSGLGLGLSISRQNVEASGGTLTVRDVPGTGCVFTMRLSKATSKPQRDARAGWRSHPRIAFQVASNPFGPHGLAVFNPARSASR